MISAGINRKPNQIGKVNKSNKSLVMMHQQKNTIKNYLVSRPINIMMKNNQSNFINEQKSTKLRQQLTTVNDENCSYNANIINPVNGLQQQNHYKSQTIEKHNNQKHQDNRAGNNIISLKKKIKKCQHPLTNYHSFRERITFRKKLFQNSHNQQSSLPSTNNEQTTFFVFRESEVFISSRSKELVNRIVVQRMDNDAETDDEQVESFVKRMVGDFVQCVGKFKAMGEQKIGQIQSITATNYQSQEHDQLHQRQIS